MRQFDKQLLERLIDISKSRSYNHYDRFDWPEHLEATQLWCDEDLLTTYGTDVHAALTEQQLISLSKWEAINFFSLNVHGIKSALEFVARSIYERPYRDISEYMHIFLAEENAHMWFFARFCQMYAGKIYPHVSMPSAAAENPVERDLYLFASTLIFEEYVDFYNHKVGRNPQVPKIVQEINQQHHIDESRHISFGREVVKDLLSELAAQDSTGDVLARVRQTIEKIFIYFIGLMYNPQVYADAVIVQTTGFATPAALRNHLRSAPSRKAFHHLWFKRTADFFVKQGVIDDSAFLKA